MTRKDFVAMADTIRQMANTSDAAMVAETFAKVAQRLNPNFDTTRFIEACTRPQS